MTNRKKDEMRQGKVRYVARDNETQVLFAHKIGNSPIRKDREKENHSQERRERERQSEW